MKFVRNTDFISIPTNNKLMVARIHFDPANYSDSLFDEYDIYMPNHIRRAFKKRKCEYLAGRICCKYLLTLNGYSTYQVSSTNRIPVWPSSIRGSISHSAPYAVAVISQKSGMESLGIDCEAIVCNKTAQKLKPYILTENEEIMYREYGMPFPTFFTLVFSAKEAFYKLISQSFKDTINFTDAELTYIDLVSQTYKIELLGNLKYHHELKSIYNGYFIFFGDHIMTITHH